MAQPFTAKLGTFDFADYLRVDEQVEPSPAFETPAFSDAPFGEGQPLVSLDAKNREMAWPIFLNDNTKDLLHDLIARANIACELKGQLEWKDTGATRSTFYDVTYARFDPEYRYRRGVYGWLAGTLRVWCAPPYGHTATERIVATAVGTALTVATTVGVAGDADGLPQYDYFTAANPGLGGRNTLIAPLPNASYQPFIPPASLAKTARATVTADALAPASQTLMMATVADAAVSDFARIALPGAVYGGRQRILAAFKPARYSGAALSLAAPDARAVGATAVANANLGYQLVDLGVYSVPSSVPTTVLRLGIGPRPQMTDEGPLQLNVTGDRRIGALGGIYIVPDEQTAAVVERTAQPVAGRWFTTSTTQATAAAPTSDDYGNTITYSPTPAAFWVGPSGLSASYALDTALMTVGPVMSDVRARAVFKPATAAGVSLYAKRDAAGANVAGIFFPNPSSPYVAISGNDLFGGGTAPAVFLQPTSLYYGASTLLEMTVVARGSVAYANLRLLGAATVIGIYTGGAGVGPTSVPIASVGFNDAVIAGIAGRGALLLDQSPGAQAVQYVGWEALAGAAGASERLLVDTVAGDVTKTTPASSVGATEIRPLANRLVGRVPKLTASQQTFAVISGPVDGGSMNTSTSVTIRVRERFRFAR